MEECTQYILYVDGKEIIKKEKGVSDSLTFASVDLQGKDKYTEILMQEHGGDYDNTRCYFYRYDEGKLVKAKASYNLPVTPNRFSPRSDKKKKNVAYIQMGCHFDKGFPYVRAYGNGKFAVGILHGKYNQKIKWVKFKLANNFKISQVKSTNKATSNANKDKVSGKAKFVLHYYKGDKDIRYYSIKGKKYAAANKAMKKQAVAAYKEQGME